MATTTLNARRVGRRVSGGLAAFVAVLLLAPTVFAAAPTASTSLSS
jgi:hypothetical protein